jgi:small GTP-binding protein
MTILLIIKVLIIGDSGVGKSSVLRVIKNEEFKPNYDTTIALDFAFSSYQHNGENIKIQIWDTAGQERYQDLIAAYYRGAHGIIVAYDTCNRESFENVHKWIANSKQHITNDVAMVLIGNKTDLESMRHVSYEEGTEMAKQYNIPFYETSSKKEKNINECFEKMIKTIISKHEDENDELFVEFDENDRINLYENRLKSMNRKIKFGKCCCIC